MRLIDADVLREEVYSWGMNDYEPSDFTDAIDDAPTVEAIPKDQYEARLKADMVAMLTDIQLEIEELDLKDSFLDYQRGAEETREYIANLIQQKIDSLKMN
jgi:hypothetical protein